MPHKRKDGTERLPIHTIIDDLTFRTDLSRQRKWQIRKRRQHRCATCGEQMVPKNKIRGNQIILDTDYECERCKQITADRVQRGILQGREQRDDAVETDAEGFVD